jgi:hypothetical protein
MLEELFTEQRTDEWHKQRMGKFTASRFGELMTNARKKDEVLGATAVSYIYEKGGRTLNGRTQGNLRSGIRLGNGKRTSMQGLL